MSDPQTGRWWHRIRLLGLLWATLALAGQLALGGMVPPAAAASPDPLAALTVFCHAADAPDSSAPRHHRPADCALCPLCVAMAHPAALPAPMSVVPTPAILPLRRVWPTSAPRAPPLRAVAAAFPRGPPPLT